MKRSRYVSFVPAYPAPGQVLGFHWLTLAMAVFDEELYSLVQFPELFASTRMPPETASQLVRMGFLVEDHVDERAETERWHTEVRSSRRTFRAMVLTTYDCNFACTYCVEEGIKKPVQLQPDLAARMVAWIIARLEEQGSEQLYLNFYGGEPLLNLAGLERVAAPLHAYAHSRGLEFQGSVTTNGALLDRKTAERLAKVGVSLAKVTLDGDREAHDARRPFKGGGGSFDLILRNLEEVWDLLEIRLSGNLDCHNFHAVPRLLDLLAARGLADKVCGLCFGGTSGQTRAGFGRQPGPLALQPLTPTEKEGAALSPALMAAGLLVANRAVVRRGLPARRPIGANLCLLNQGDNAVVLDPVGRIYKCPTLVGYEGFAVGDLSQDRLRTDHVRMRPEDLDDCLDCRWFAVCGGGCRFMSFLESGDLRGRHCDRDYFLRHGDDLIRMEYECLQREQDDVR